MARRRGAPIGVYNGNSYVSRRFREAQEESKLQLTQARKNALLEKEREWMYKLLDVDPDGLEWYQDDNNIPPYGSIKERIRLIQERINELVKAREK